MTLKNKVQAIYGYPDYGALFGIGNDLRLQN
jgi:hypothetical protein